MGIATALKEFRKEHGMEQDDLAKLLGTTQQTISNWESGTMPRANALKRISQVLASYERSHVSTGPQNELAAGLPALEKQSEKPLEKPVDKASEAYAFPWPEFIVSSADPQNIVVSRTHTNALDDEVIGRRWYTELRNSLTEALGNTVEFTMDAPISFQSLRQRADYLSNKVCAEIKCVKQPRNAFMAAERGIYTLATLREMLERNNTPRQHYILVVVFTSGGGLLSLSRLMALAALHKVDVFVASSASEAARLLAKLENGQFDDPQDQDY